MRQPIGADAEERIAQLALLAFLDDYCRGMTLKDAGEWYVEAFSENGSSGGAGLNAS